MSQDLVRQEFNRVLWHSRRGMLELDLVLEPFVKDCYADLDVEQQDCYRALLTCQDQELFDWFLKKKTVPDAALANMVALILNYKKTHK